MAREPQTLEEFNKKRKARSAAIALAIVAVVVFVYAVTFIRGPGLIADRPSYGVGGSTTEETQDNTTSTNEGVTAVE